MVLAQILCGCSNKLKTIVKNQFHYDEGSVCLLVINTEYTISCGG